MVYRSIADAGLLAGGTCGIQGRQTCFCTTVDPSCEPDVFFFPFVFLFVFPVFSLKKLFVSLFCFPCFFFKKKNFYSFFSPFSPFFFALSSPPVDFVPFFSVFALFSSFFFLLFCFLFFSAFLPFCFPVFVSLVFFKKI